jgi:hypothetical protein
MKFFAYEKDGGQESKVWGFFIAEIKSLFSVVLLHFKDGSREAFHSHAFNAVSWVLWGQLNEEQFNGIRRTYKPSLVPVWTPRTNFHMVKSVGNTFVISFRGPWVNFWNEYLPDTHQIITLTHGRKIVDSVVDPRPYGLITEATNGAQ